MTEQLIIPLDEIRPDEEELAGKKGVGLGMLIDAGKKVPDGFVITGEAWQLYLKENRLDRKLTKLAELTEENPSRLAPLAAKFRSLIRKGSFPQRMEHAIVKAYERLGEMTPVAVRSSLIIKDQKTSVSVEHRETFLNVTGREVLLDLVRQCYISLWDSEAAAARRRKGIDHQSVGIAIVVQRMVECEKAGILYTMNPLNKSSEEILIGASWGLGISVTSGRIHPDYYVCDRNGQCRSFTVGEKESQIFCDPEGGITEQVIPAEIALTQCLTPDEQILLCEEAISAEHYSGCPVALEWGLRDGQVFFFQAEKVIPVMTEKEIAREEEEEKNVRKYLEQCSVSDMARSSMKLLAEKLPKALYPLDYFMADTINRQEEVLLRKAGISVSMRPQIDDDGIMILPKGELRPNRHIFRGIGLRKELNDLEFCSRELTGQMIQFRKELQEMIQVDAAVLTLEEAITRFMGIHDYVEKLAEVHFRYAVFPGMTFGGMKTILHDADSDLTEYDLYADLSDRDSAAKEDLLDVILAIQGNELLKSDISSGLSYQDICRKYPYMQDVFENFLQKYGFKSDLSGYCLGARSFLEEPERLLYMIRPQIEYPVKEQDRRFELLMQKIKAVCRPEQYTKVRQDIGYLRSIRSAGEESQYCWEAAFYCARQILKRISVLLYDTEDYFDNVAYLFPEELEKVAQEGGLPFTLRGKIDRRREKRALAVKVWEQCKRLPFRNETGTLKGIPGIGGEASGTARVIRSPKEFYRMRPGNILVCPYTDPEWNPLIRMASAVVTDMGTEVSHTAFAASQYGIPVVPGTGFATELVRDGIHLTVSGTTGEVIELKM